MFVLLFFLAGSDRAGYDPMRYPVSSLAMGPEGWLQTLNFFLAGGLMVAFSFGLRADVTEGFGRVWGQRWLRIVGIGLMGAGAFCTDPIYGFPATLPLTLAQFSWHGHLHDLFSLPVFVGMQGACYVFALRYYRAGSRLAGAYAFVSGMLMMTFFVMATLGFKQMPGWVEWAGLFQRLTLVIGLSWVGVLAVRRLSMKHAR